MATRRAWLTLAAVPLGLTLAGRRADAVTIFDIVPDRDLIAKAQAEKTASFYVAMNGKDELEIAKAFAAVSGIEVEPLSLASRALAPRVQTEQRGGHFECDVVATTSYDVELMKRAGLLDRYVPPEARAFDPGFVDPDGYWATCFALTYVFIYNTARVAAGGLPVPKRWSDFADPQWRGKFAVFAGSVSWYAGLRRALGAAGADALLRSIAANDPVIATTRQVATNFTADGEYAAALAVFGHEADRIKAAGRPVEYVNAAPVVVESAAIGIAKNGPHPNAARLFVRWFLSRQGQSWMVGATGRISGRRDVASNPRIWNPQLRIAMTNAADVVHYNADLQAFDQMFKIPT